MSLKPTHYGIMVYLDVSEIGTLNDATILDREGYEIEASIVKNPNGDNLIFLADIDNTDEDWGGHFRCFLYPADNKILGTFKYVKEANSSDEKIDGSYSLKDDVVKIWGKVWVENTLKYGLYTELHPFAGEKPGIIRGETQGDNKIPSINTAIAEWFSDNPDTQKVLAKELMGHFISKGIFKKDHREGFPIRNVLRKLDAAGRLKDIPTVHPERKASNTNWYFVRDKDQ